VLLAVLVVAPLFWKVISFREEDVASLEELQDWRAGKNPEDEYGYVIDGEAIPFNGESKGVPKQYPISSKVKAAPADEEVATINLSGGDDEEDETPPPKKTAPVKKSVPAVAKTATSVAKTIAGDACSLVKNKSGWILQESAFSTKDAAAARVAALGKKNISARALAQSCITSGKTGWIVWLGNIQSSEAAARTAAASQQKTLRSAGFAGAKVLLKPLK
jgi:cell division protein FtsN